MNSIYKAVAALITAVASCGQVAAQFDKEIFMADMTVDTSQIGELRLNVGSLLFFKDNEFSTTVMDGYTLPGFRLQPTVSYMPSANVSVELGANLLRFWGTDHYPNMAYRDIATWTGGERKNGFHIVPFLRVRMDTSFGLSIVLGDIYGGANHRLIRPLYAPELNLTADPEAGAQLLYTNKWLDADMWVNWESMIYRNDVHQEEFVFGLATRFKYNSEQSRLHFYSPVQLLAQHRGGEIDTIKSHSVQTLMNGAVGFGARWDIGYRKLRSATIEADLLGYYQQAGELWPFNSGSGVYVHGNVDVDKVRFKAGYFYCDKFISMFGLPFFGAVSTKKEGLTYDKPSTVYLGADYAHTFTPGYSLGVNVDVYLRDGSTSFAAGIYMRINPNFLLYKKKR